MEAKAQVTIQADESVRIQGTGKVIGKGKKSQLHIKSKSVTHNGRIEKLKQTLIDAVDVEVRGSMQSETISITADNELNQYGDIKADFLTIDSDHWFLEAGIAQGRKSLQATTLTTVNNSDIIESANTSIHAAVMFNSGVIAAYDLTTNACVKINIGLETISLPASGKLADIFTAQKLLSIAKMGLKAAISPAANAALSALDFGIRGLSLAQSAKSTADQFKKLHAGGADNLRARHVIKLAYSAKNVATTAKSLGQDATSFKKHHSDSISQAKQAAKEIAKQPIQETAKQARSAVQSASAKAAEITKAATLASTASAIKSAVNSQTAKDLGGAAVDLLMPTATQDGLFGLNTGIQATAKQTTTSAISVNLGHQKAQRQNMTAAVMANFGNREADEVSLKAYYYHAEGNDKIRDKLDLNVGTVHIAKDHELEAGSITGKAEKFKTERDLALQKAQLEIGTLDIAAEKKVTATDHSNVKIKQAALGESFRLAATDHSRLTTTDDLNIDDTQAVTIDKTSHHQASSIHNAGEYSNESGLSGLTDPKAPNAVTSAELLKTSVTGTTHLGGKAKVKHSENNGAELITGQLEAEQAHNHNQSIITGTVTASKCASNTGQQKLNGGKLITKEYQQMGNGEVALKDKAALVAEKGSLGGQQATAENHSTLKIDQMTVEKAAQVTTDKTSSTIIDTLDVHGKMDADGFVGSFTVSEDGNATLSKAKSVEFHAGSEGKLNGHVKAKTLKNDADALQGNGAKLDLNIFEDDGRSTWSQTTVHAKQGEYGGNTQFREGSSVHVSDNHIKQGGELGLEDSHLTSDNIRADGRLVTRGKLQDNEDGTKSYSTSIQLKNELKVTGTGGTDLDHSYVDADTVALEKGSQSKTNHTAIHAKNMQQDGNLNYEGSLQLNIDEKYSSSQSSKTQGTADSHYSLKSENEDIRGGHQSAGAVNFDVENLRGGDAVSMLKQTGRFEQFDMTGSIATKTKDNVRLNDLASKAAVTLEAKSIEVIGDQKSRATHLKAAEGGIDIKANVTAQDGVKLEAKKDINNQGKKINGGAHTTVISEEGKVTNSDGEISSNGQTHVKGTEVINKRSGSHKHATIDGEKTFVEATEGDVYNNDTVKARKRLVVEAEGDIVAEAVEQTYRDKHDTRKKHHSALYQGGDGKEEGSHLEGVGMVLKAKGKVKNDASVMRSTGDNVVSGDKGVETKARHHTYVAKKTSRGIHRKIMILGKKVGSYRSGTEYTTETETEVTQAMIQSTKGKNTIQSKDGGVDLQATVMMAPNGTTVVAKKDIKATALKTKKITRKQKSEFLGLNKSDRRNVDEQATSTVIATLSGDIKMQSTEGRVDAKGTDFVSKGAAKLILEGKKGVSLREEVCDHSVKEKSSGFSVSAPAVDAAEATARGKLGNHVEQNIAIIGAMKQMSDADNDLELAAGLANTGVAAAGIGSSLLSYAGIGVQYTEKQSEQNYQTAGPGSVSGFSAVEARSSHGKVTIGVDFHAVEDATFEGKEVEYVDTELKSSFKQEENSTSAGFNFATMTPTVGASHSHAKGKATNSKRRQLKLNGTLTEKADKVTQTNTDIEAARYQADIGERKMIDKADTSQVRGENYGADTMGNVSAGQVNEDSKKVAKSSSLHIREGIKEGDAKIGKTTYIGGGQVTTGEGTENYYHTDNPEQSRSTVKEFNKKNNFNVSVCLAPENDQTTGEKNYGVKAVHVSHDYLDHQSQLDENGRTITHHKKHNVSVVIPIPDFSDKSQEQPTHSEDSMDVVEPTQDPSDEPTMVSSDTNKETEATANEPYNKLPTKTSDNDSTSIISVAGLFGTTNDEPNMSKITDGDQELTIPSITIEPTDPKKTSSTSSTKIMKSLGSAKNKPEVAAVNQDKTPTPKGKRLNRYDDGKFAPKNKAKALAKDYKNRKEASKSTVKPKQSLKPTVSHTLVSPELLDENYAGYKVKAALPLSVDQNGLHFSPYVSGQYRLSEEPLLTHKFDRGPVQSFELSSPSFANTYASTNFDLGSKGISMGASAYGSIFSVPGKMSLENIPVFDASRTLSLDLDFSTDIGAVGIGLGSKPSQYKNGNDSTRYFIKLGSGLVGGTAQANISAEGPPLYGQVLSRHAQHNLKAIEASEHTTGQTWLQKASFWLAAPHLREGALKAQTIANTDPWFKSDDTQSCSGGAPKPGN